MTNLQRAIKLREWVRRADDVDDLEALRYWNHKADAAYLKLTHAEQAAYLEWAGRGEEETFNALMRAFDGEDTS